MFHLLLQQQEFYVVNWCVTQNWVCTTGVHLLRETKHSRPFMEIDTENSQTKTNRDKGKYTIDYIDSFR